MVWLRYTVAVSTQGNRPLVGVGVVFVRQGKVFLARRRGAHGEDSWASAGGHLEFGETLEECARREAMEELGVRVGELRVLCLSNILAYGPPLRRCGISWGYRGSGTNSDGIRRVVRRVRVVSAVRAAAAVVRTHAPGHREPADGPMVLPFLIRTIRHKFSDRVQKIAYFRTRKHGDLTLAIML